VSIVSGGNSYTLTLNGTNVWSGTNSPNVTGNGTATLTVTSAGIAAFTDRISLVDAAAGRDSVTFDDNVTNSYAHNSDVRLGNAAAGTIAFNGTSSFSTSELFASTSRNVVVASGASVSSTTGDVTLRANQQATPTAGNFFGITVLGAITTDSGSILLVGRG